MTELLVSCLKPLALKPSKVKNKKRSKGKKRQLGYEFEDEFEEKENKTQTNVSNEAMALSKSIRTQKNPNLSNTQRKKRTPNEKKIKSAVSVDQNVDVQSKANIDENKKISNANPLPKSLQKNRYVNKAIEKVSAGIKLLSASLESLTDGLLSKVKRRNPIKALIPLKINEKIDLRHYPKGIKISEVKHRGNRLLFKILEIQGEKLEFRIAKWDAPGAKFKIPDGPIDGYRSFEVLVDLNHMETQKLFKMYSEFFHQDYFPWIEMELIRNKVITRIWLIFDWDDTRAHWIPYFTDRRPFSGGKNWWPGVEVQQYNDFVINKCLTVSDIRFDQTLLHFTIISPSSSNPTVIFDEREPLKKGIRMIVLDHVELNPEQNSFGIGNIAITFRNRRALTYLGDDKVRADPTLWPFFNINFSGCLSIQILLKFNWNILKAEWTPEFSIVHKPKSQIEKRLKVRRPLQKMKRKQPNPKKMGLHNG
ncbi:unnamed protein product, partial [Mesorhabditis belari]|uniref:Uncharacterized protein n=1 Tax=Mesorhabditis belari TaxID=2138241 RepID=A0AAF3EAK3_9BILA